MSYGDYQGGRPGPHPAGAGHVRPLRDGPPVLLRGVGDGARRVRHGGGRATRGCPPPESREVDGGHVRVELALRELRGRERARAGRAGKDWHRCKPESRSEVVTAGWSWASVSVVAFRKGKSELPVLDCLVLDHVTAPVVRVGRRAELPPVVAAWPVRPFAVPGRFLDPFAGSGALVRAAHECGMDAVRVREEG